MQPEPLLGENLTFAVRFDNASPTDAGYGPFVDLYLPATGADGADAAVDDGLSFVSASYLGVPVPSSVVTLTNAGVPHPLAKSSFGDPILILPPPGFRAGDRTRCLATSLKQLHGRPAAGRHRGHRFAKQPGRRQHATVYQGKDGFHLGNDPLNNPAFDPSILADRESNDQHTDNDLQGLADEPLELALSAWR